MRGSLLLGGPRIGGCWEHLRPQRVAGWQVSCDITRTIALPREEIQSRHRDVLQPHIGGPCILMRPCERLRNARLQGSPGQRELCWRESAGLAVEVVQQEFAIHIPREPIQARTLWMGTLLYQLRLLKGRARLRGLPHPVAGKSQKGVAEHV